MEEKTIKQLKVIQLEMLRNFITICKKFNFRYYALGGTTLGTIRHHGFIPWDDDIDIGMPRDDYEKFLKYSQKYLNKGYFLQNFNSDMNYPMNFAKIRNSNTTFIEKSTKNINMNHGIYIDIFPIDGYPKNKIKQIYLELMKIIYDMRISKVFFHEIIPQKSVKGKIIGLISYIINYNKTIKEIMIKKDKLVSKYKYNDSNIVANHYGAWGKKEIMPKIYFGGGLIREFESIELVIPERYDLYLTQMYGDYMILPPEDKRKSHHNYDIIDTNKPYEYYINRAGQK